MLASAQAERKDFAASARYVGLLSSIPKQTLSTNGSCARELAEGVSNDDFEDSLHNLAARCESHNHALERVTFAVLGAEAEVAYDLFVEGHTGKKMP